VACAMQQAAREASKAATTRLATSLGKVHAKAMENQQVGPRLHTACRGLTLSAAHVQLRCRCLS
jgi:hypothetical protein